MKIEKVDLSKDVGSIFSVLGVSKTKEDIEIEKISYMPVANENMDIAPDVSENMFETPKIDTSGC